MEKESKSILLRFNDDTRDRLNHVAEMLNEIYPDAHYSAQSIARCAIVRRIEELEKIISEAQKTE